MDNRKINIDGRLETITPQEELLLKEFFQTHQQDVEDNGFTTAVMRQLPVNTSLLNKIWTSICLVAGIVILYFGHALQKLSDCLDAIKNELLSIQPTIGSIVVLFIFLSALTVIGSYSFFVKENF